MTSRQWQVWHQDEKVEQAAHDHRNQLLEKSSKHAMLDTAWRIRCRKRVLD